MSKVIVLIATIPVRKKSCERLLEELTKQSQVPDGVILVLDGYGDAPAPVCPLPIIAEHRTTALAGAGQRWLALKDSAIDNEDIIICLDDDIVTIEARNLIKGLVAAVESGGGAAAAMGKDLQNKAAPPGPHSRGNLIYGAGCSLTVRAKHLIGLHEFSDIVKVAGGPDALGVLGDDDALVSAFLWKSGVVIRHASTGNIYPAPGLHSSSQTAAKAKQRVREETQKLAIKRITGWPWEVFKPAALVRR
jgi:hypothetical protein